jgi:SAM-dependent methyltransferase
MVNWLRQYVRRQQFVPGVAGVFINPFFIARSGLGKAIADIAPQLSGKLLDVGCGTKPYRKFFSVTEYVGLDMDGELTRKRGLADYLYDGGRFPFADNNFDSILCNQVLEHVFNPNEFLGEIHRVLRPGGKLLLTIPFVWDEHEQPYDYARYSSFGLQSLLENRGFKILQHRKLAADASILFQLGNAYLYKISKNWPKSIRLVLVVTVMALVSVTGVVAGKLLPGNPDLYLDHVVLAEKAI